MTQLDVGTKCPCHAAEAVVILSGQVLLYVYHRDTVWGHSWH